MLLEQLENTSGHRRARRSSVGFSLALKYDDGGFGDPGLCGSRLSRAEQGQMTAAGHVGWSTLSGASRSAMAQQLHWSSRCSDPQSSSRRGAWLQGRLTLARRLDRGCGGTRPHTLFSLFSILSPVAKREGESLFSPFLIFRDFS
ncbi:hypothetical protein NL676_039190 [Syzygium grande]|nr:hypothetical protein NL676_039190 [Syzygium grande]